MGRNLEIDKLLDVELKLFCLFHRFPFYGTRWLNVGLKDRQLVSKSSRNDQMLNRRRRGSLARVVPSHQGRVTRTRTPQVHALFPCKLRCTHLPFRLVLLDRSGAVPDSFSVLVPHLQET
jgi:hypothetical protein